MQTTVSSFDEVRPQSGLPDSSVSILCAWLFEHFLDPYPIDSEKLMLAKQTGLTRTSLGSFLIYRFLIGS
ncbi:unnamed protein product [Musa hybrid cultivar]